MEYIAAPSLYKREGPTRAQLDLIMREVIKLHAVKNDIPYVFDVWVVPNIGWMYGQVKQKLGQQRGKVETIIDYYNQMELDRLPSCFVHGDIIKSNILMADKKTYILDFSVVNKYPRIQELAIMAANLLAGSKLTIHERVEQIVNSYESAGGILTKNELQSLSNYTAAAIAMEYMGSFYDESEASSDEVEYWRSLALDSLGRL